MLTSFWNFLKDFLQLVKEDTKAAFILFLVTCLAFCGMWHVRTEGIHAQKERECDSAKTEMLVYFKGKYDTLSQRQQEVLNNQNLILKKPKK
jgi:hypothetical protein